jgi:autotransporter-associated beta strand protein/T5SS/PEP-CTERM-associated repeat protein
MVVTDGLVESTGARLGESTGGVGGATLTRARWNCRGWMYVGRSGSGSLEIASSALATSNAYLGANAGGHGVVTVTDGTWAVDGALDVGGSGVGVLSLGRGAVTTRTTVIDGSLSTGSGLVTVTEGTLATGGSLTIGDSGAGSLVVTGGAVSGSTTVVGGFSSRANGVVTVTGGTFSTLGNLTVGSSGTGRLVVGSSGVVTVGGTLSRGSKGTIVIDPGGTLQVGMGGTGGALAANVATNGTLAFNLSGSSSAAAVISGSGGFAKLGSGTLSLTGSNTYSGGTQIRAGRLIGTVGTIRGPIANAAALTFAQTVDGTFASGLSGTGSLTKAGSGTLTIAAATSLSGPVTVQQGGLRLGDARALAAAPLTPLVGGVVSLTPRLQATVGGLNPNAGGVIDVGDGAITVAGGLGTAALLAALGTGRGDGTWSGTAGIVSSVARADLARSVPRTVGWLDNGGGSQTFAYAAGGDTNLDWQVDILDAANFLAGGKFDTSSPASWNEGDFGYDGIVDILDAADFLSSGLFDAGGYNAAASPAGVAAVPEPTMPGVIWLAAVVAGTAGPLRRIQRGRG